MTARPFRSAFIFLFAVITLSRAQDNYLAREGKRCIGGSSVAIGTADTILGNCIASCNSRNDCYGVNWHLGASSCIARSVGCNVQDDDFSIFYQKNQSILLAQKREVPVTLNDASGNALVNFLLMTGQRCFGGTSLAAGTAGNIQDCSVLCLGNPDCVGFNWRQVDETCVARTAGCNMADDQGTAFYQKRIPPHFSDAAPVRPKVTQPTTPTTTTPDLMAAQQIILQKFVLILGKKCAGGPRLKDADAGTYLAQCAAYCLLNDDCVGFNVQTSDGSCAGRSSWCVEVDDSTSVFYRKLISQATTAMPGDEVVEGDMVWQPSIVMPNYMVVAGWECEGGPETQIDEPQKMTMQCAAICDRQVGGCHGFTVYPTRRLCIVRNMQCKIAPNSDGTLLYRRKQTPVSTPSLALLFLPTVPTVPPTTTKAPPTTTTSPSTTVATAKAPITTMAPSTTTLTTVKVPITAATAPRTTAKPATTAPINNDDLAVSRTGNFDVKGQRKCIGGTSSRFDDGGDDLDSCEQACNTNPNCYAFNLDITLGSCTMRSVGCNEEADPKFYLFVKKPKTTPPPPTTTKPIIPTIYEPVLSGLPYDQVTDARCSGGSSQSLGTAHGFTACVNRCSQDVKCYGFNLVEETDDCAFRSSGCNMLTGTLGMSFYRIIRA